jgi:hypothetical protein
MLEETRNTRARKKKPEKRPKTALNATSVTWLHPVNNRRSAVGGSRWEVEQNSLMQSSLPLRSRAAAIEAIGVLICVRGCIIANRCSLA